MAKKDDIAGEKIVATHRIYEVTIKGINGLLMNRLPDLSQPKAEKKAQAKEDPIDKERRTWREKMYTAGDRVIIPGENIHQSLQDGAKYWGSKIPGEGNKTYTDVIVSAVVCEDIDLGMTTEDPAIVPFGKNCNGNPSKGKKSGCRVYKIRPLINNWSGKFTIHVFDARVTPDVLRTILECAGTFKGLGDWRPIYGRYQIESIEEAA